MGSKDDLFTLIMEAEESDTIADFNADIPSGDAIADEPAAPADDAGSGSSDSPPPMDDGIDNADFNFSDTEGENPDSTGDEGNSDASNDDATADEDDASTKNIGDKTNAILNERLYRRLTERNNQIESDIKQIQQVFSVLPYEITTELEKPLNQLKTALSKGQGYAIDHFVNSEYGTNLTFYEKLNTLYTLIEKNIDDTIRKANKED